MPATPEERGEAKERAISNTEEVLQEEVLKCQKVSRWCLEYYLQVITTKMVGRSQIITRNKATVPSQNRNHMADRVNNLEVNLQQGLQEIKDKVLSNPNTPIQKDELTNAIAEFESRVLKEIQEVKNMLEEMNKEVEYSKQEIKSNCLVINGIKEKNNSDISTEIISIIQNRINIDVSKSDLDYCYRLGQKSEASTNKTRPVVVRFVNRWLRDDIFNLKKNLKGSGIVINECLTAKQIVLLKKVREKVGVKNCWTTGDFHANCLENHDVKEQILVEALDGKVDHDDDFYKHIFCVTKKANLIDDNGVVDTSNFEIDMAAVIDPHNMDNVAAIVRKCLIEKDDIMTTIKEAVQCFFSEEHNL
ncbi:unnamed protein product [Ceutorhynchus assimilis]|uniref:Uncharacterized protein n=1 Tax=Ceutorhynchus assimilis TaxID=467358 RepID=A0A9N9MHS6_9CUCU|nr:unnamed protein product [Ceutorhynchus assimilis]